MLKKYDGMFIFPPSVDEEAVSRIVEQIGEEASRCGGNLGNVELMGVRPFARRMMKFESGFYARIDLNLAPSAVAPFQARLKLNENVLRVQVLVKPPVPVAG